MQMSNWLYWTIVVLGAGLLCQAAQWARKADLPPWLYRKREDQKRGEIAMSDGWHYAEGRKTVGPLTLTEMQRVLSKVSDPPQSTGLESWTRRLEARWKCARTCRANLQAAAAARSGYLA